MCHGRNIKYNWVLARKNRYTNRRKNAAKMPSRNKQWMHWSTKMGHKLVKEIKGEDMKGQYEIGNKRKQERIEYKQRENSEQDFGFVDHVIVQVVSRVQGVCFQASRFTLGVEVYNYPHVWLVSGTYRMCVHSSSGHLCLPS